MPDDTERLTYFTHEVDGRLHSGWYRHMPGGRIEVYSRTHGMVEFTGKLGLIEQAGQMLEQMVREEEAFPAPRRHK